MKQFLSTLPRNIIGCFRGRMILWHVLAILLTVAFVTSGFDWVYYIATHNAACRRWTVPAVRIGGLLPIVLPLLLIATGILVRSAKTTMTGWAIAQAALLGLLISSAYKAITGRVHPPHVTAVDVSHFFQFGFLRGGMFWGWPSSHATIAFAMAFTIFTLFPKRRWLGCLAIVYALYVGVGVSMTIHWFSDSVAGAIMGAVVGRVVGNSFLPVSAGSTAFTDARPS